MASTPSNALENTLDDDLSVLNAALEKQVEPTNKLGGNDLDTLNSFLGQQTTDDASVLDSFLGQQTPDDASVLDSFLNGSVSAPVSPEQLSPEDARQQKIEQQRQKVLDEVNKERLEFVKQSRFFDAVPVFKTGWDQIDAETKLGETLLGDTTGDASKGELDFSKQLDKAAQRVVDEAKGPLNGTWLPDMANMYGGMGREMYYAKEEAALGAAMGIPLGLITSPMTGGLSIPAAMGLMAKAGFRIGTAKNWYFQGVGAFYKEFTANGMDHETARVAALAGAMPYAAIEFLTGYAPGLKGLYNFRPILSSIIKRSVLPYVKEMVKQGVGETLEESLQQITQDVTQNIFANIQNEAKGTALEQYTGSEIFQRAVSTFTQSFMPILLGSIGMGSLHAPGLMKAHGTMKNIVAKNVSPEALWELNPVKKGDKKTLTISENGKELASGTIVVNADISRIVNQARQSKGMPPMSEAELKNLQGEKKEGKEGEETEQPADLSRISELTTAYLAEHEGDPARARRVGAIQGLEQYRKDKDYKWFFGLIDKDSIQFVDNLDGDLDDIELDDNTRVMGRAARIIGERLFGRPVAFFAATPEMQKDVVAEGIWTPEGIFLDARHPMKGLGFMMTQTHEAGHAMGSWAKKLETSGDDQYMKTIRETVQAVPAEARQRIVDAINKITKKKVDAKDAMFDDEIMAMMFSTVLADEKAMLEVVKTNPALMDKIIELIKAFYEAIRSTVEIVSQGLSLSTGKGSVNHFTNESMSAMFGANEQKVRDNFLKIAKAYVAQATANGETAEAAQKKVKPLVDAAATPVFPPKQVRKDLLHKAKSGLLKPENVQLDLTPDQRKAESPRDTLKKMLVEEGLMKEGQQPEDVLINREDNKPRMSLANRDKVEQVNSAIDQLKKDGVIGETGRGFRFVAPNADINRMLNLVRNYFVLGNVPNAPEDEDLLKRILARQNLSPKVGYKKFADQKRAQLTEEAKQAAAVKEEKTATRQARVEANKSDQKELSKSEVAFIKQKLDGKLDKDTGLPVGISPGDNVRFVSPSTEQAKFHVIRSATPDYWITDQNYKVKKEDFPNIELLEKDKASLVYFTRSGVTMDRPIISARNMKGGPVFVVKATSGKPIAVNVRKVKNYWVQKEPVGKAELSDRNKRWFEMRFMGTERQVGDRTATSGALGAIREFARRFQVSEAELEPYVRTRMEKELDKVLRDARLVNLDAIRAKKFDVEKRIEYLAKSISEDMPRRVRAELQQRQKEPIIYRDMVLLPGEKYSDLSTQELVFRLVALNRRIPTALQWELKGSLGESLKKGKTVSLQSNIGAGEGGKAATIEERVGAKDLVVSETRGIDVINAGIDALQSIEPPLYEEVKDKNGNMTGKLKLPKNLTQGEFESLLEQDEGISNMGLSDYEFDRVSNYIWKARLGKDLPIDWKSLRGLSLSEEESDKLEEKRVEIEKKPVEIEEKSSVTPPKPKPVSPNIERLTAQQRQDYLAIASVVRALEGTPFVKRDGDRFTFDNFPKEGSEQYRIALGVVLRGMKTGTVAIPDEQMAEQVLNSISLMADREKGLPVASIDKSEESPRMSRTTEELLAEMNAPQSNFRFEYKDKDGYTANASIGLPAGSTIQDARNEILKAKPGVEILKLEQFNLKQATEDYKFRNLPSRPRMSRTSQQESVLSKYAGEKVSWEKTADIETRHYFKGGLEEMRKAPRKVIIEKMSALLTARDIPHVFYARWLLNSAGKHFAKKPSTAMAKLMEDLEKKLDVLKSYQAKATGIKEAQVGDMRNLLLYLQTNDASVLSRHDPASDILERSSNFFMSGALRITSASTPDERAAIKMRARNASKRLGESVEKTIKEYYKGRFGDTRMAQEKADAALLDIWNGRNPATYGMEIIGKDEYGGRFEGQYRVLTPMYMAEVANAASSVTASRTDKALEYYKSAGLLSAIATLMQNPISNAMRQMYEFGPKKLLRDIISKKGPTQSFREMGLMLRSAGYFHSKAWRVAADSFANEMPILLWGKYGQKVDPNSHRQAIKGRFGKIVRLPYRFLTWGDEYFKMISMMNQLTEIGASELGPKATTSDLKKWFQGALDPMGDEKNMIRLQEALRVSTEHTWQNKPGNAVEAFMAFRSRLPGGEFIMPFVNTPMNLFTQGLRMSPLGVLNMGRKAIWSSARKNKEGKYLLNLDNTEFASDAAEQIIAWGALGVIAMLTHRDRDDDEEDQPLMTGSAPSFRIERGKEGFMRREIMPPMSIRIGSKMWDYSRVEPLATILPVIIDHLNLVNTAKDDGSVGKAIATAWASMAVALTDKTFFGGLQDLLAAFENPERAAYWASNFTSSWVPNIVRSTIRHLDPYQRDTTIKDEAFSSGWGLSWAQKTGYNLIPMGSQYTGTYPTTDFWGKPLKKSMGAETPQSDILYRLMSYSGLGKVYTTKDNEFNRMIHTWNTRERFKYKDPNAARAGVDKVYSPFWFIKEPKYIKMGETKTGQDIKHFMSDEEYRDYVKTVGEFTFERAKRMNFNIDNPTPFDIRRLQKVREAGRRVARNRLKRKVYSEIREEA